MIARTARAFKYEHQGSGSYLENGTLVRVLREEGDKSVIRGLGLEFCCNPAKQPHQAVVTMMVLTKELFLTPTQADIEKRIRQLSLNLELAKAEKQMHGETVFNIQLLRIARADLRLGDPFQELREQA